MYLYDGRGDKKAKPTKRTIAVVSVDRIKNPPHDSMTIRKEGRSDWSLFYCESGKMFFEDQVLLPGQMWIYAPGVFQKYMTYQQDKTVYWYLHFTGSEVEEMLTALGIVFSVPLKPKDDFSAELFHKIRYDISREDPLWQLRAEYHTLRLFACLAVAGKNAGTDGIMKRVTDDMEHTYFEGYQAQKYAEMLKISVSRFNHLFKESVGISPLTYYIEIRMDNASRMLETTNLKIKEVAVRSGYEDPLYFAQVFKKHTGLAPGVYRKLYRKEI